MNIVRHQGFNLIEVIIFMLLMSALIGGCLSIFSYSLEKSPATNNDATALYLAQQRMEIILRQKRDLGFVAFDPSSFDPCTRTTPSTLSPCTGIPGGYTISSALIDNWLGNTNYKHIIVNVSGNGHAKLETLVSNF